MRSNAAFAPDENTTSAAARQALFRREKPGLPAGAGYGRNAFRPYACDVICHQM